MVTSLFCANENYSNVTMRIMAEDSRGDLSEDEQSPTDASEDSVEVRVVPITKPRAPITNARPANHFSDSLSRLPRKFRKAFEKTFGAKDDPTPEFGGVRNIIAQNLAVTFPTEFPLDSSVKTGRESPREPSSSNRAPRSRRKPSEPRRVNQESSKRAWDEEWHPRKILRREDPVSTPDTFPAFQQTTIDPNNFLRHLIPTQLLLPPAWPPIVRNTYAQLVGLAPQLGFLPGASYPLLPILSPRMTIGEKPTSCEVGMGVKLQNRRENGLAGKPFRLPEGVRKTNSTDISLVRTPQEVLPAAGSSSNHKLRNATTKNFLSVESILSSSLEKRKEPTNFFSEYDYEDPRLAEEEDTIQVLLSPSKNKQRNYKNMTRERRIEANARERTRVHTISAAFDTLRQAVPSFSHNQKLSKLSILRIASTYILSLSRLAGLDYSCGQTNPSFEECVDLTTKTIQIEGKAKKKRDE